MSESKIKARFYCQSVTPKKGGSTKVTFQVQDDTTIPGNQRIEGLDRRGSFTLKVPKKCGTFVPGRTYILEFDEPTFDASGLPLPFVPIPEDSGRGDNVARAAVTAFEVSRRLASGQLSPDVVYGANRPGRDWNAVGVLSHIPGSWGPAAKWGEEETQKYLDTLAGRKGLPPGSFVDGTLSVIPVWSFGMVPESEVPPMKDEAKPVNPAPEIGPTRKAFGFTTTTTGEIMPPGSPFSAGESPKPQESGPTEEEIGEAIKEGYFGGTDTPAEKTHHILDAEPVNSFEEIGEAIKEGYFATEPVTQPHPDSGTEVPPEVAQFLEEVRTAGGMIESKPSLSDPDSRFRIAGALAILIDLQNELIRDEQQWGADLVNDSRAWGGGMAPYPTMIEPHYEGWIKIQTRQNDLIGSFLDLLGEGPDRAKEATGLLCEWLARGTTEAEKAGYERGLAEARKVAKTEPEEDSEPTATTDPKPAKPTTTIPEAIDRARKGLGPKTETDPSPFRVCRYFHTSSGLEVEAIRNLETNVDAVVEFATTSGLHAERVDGSDLRLACLITRPRGRFHEATVIPYGSWLVGIASPRIFELGTDDFQSIPHDKFLKEYGLTAKPAELKDPSTMVRQYRHVDHPKRIVEAIQNTGGNLDDVCRFATEAGATFEKFPQADTYSPYFIKVYDQSKLVGRVNIGDWLIRVLMINGSTGVIGAARESRFARWADPEFRAAFILVAESSPAPPTPIIDDPSKRIARYVFKDDRDSENDVLAIRNYGTNVDEVCKLATEAGLKPVKYARPGGTVLTSVAVYVGQGRSARCQVGDWLVRRIGAPDNTFIHAEPDEGFRANFEHDPSPV